ncbi:50S ribosomal protein L23 [Patescibacteria group bacterium]|nr:50S ribosomal protein L23 [Patescibacteria group bacterium]
MLFFKKKDKSKPQDQPEIKKEIKKEETKTKAAKEQEIDKPKKSPSDSVKKKTSVAPSKPVKKIDQKLIGSRVRIAHSVLIKPILTEKATFNEANNVYTFEVSFKANKVLIKKAIKELYNLEPFKVNIIRTKGKSVRYGRFTGRTKDRKKALVFLKPGQKIEFIKNK